MFNKSKEKPEAITLPMVPIRDVVLFPLHDDPVRHRAPRFR
jgi:hypothetical protein